MAAFPSRAFAGPDHQPAEPDPVRVTVDAGTDFPVDVGGRVTIELPARVRLSTTAGVMPGIYVEALNAFLVGVGAYTESTADLVAATLTSSFILRNHVGWRPLPKYGFYVEAGYGIVTLGGDLTGAEVIAAATGREPSSGDETRSFDASSTLHMVDVELGWELTFVEHLAARFAVGGAFTVGASTSIEPTFEPQAPRATRLFTDQAEAYLTDVFESYAFTPVITVALGGTF